MRMPANPIDGMPANSKLAALLQERISIMDHLPLNQTKLRALIKQCRHLNVFPIFLDHYYPKTEPNPVSDLLADLVDEIVPYLLIMKSEEISNLVSSLPSWVRMLIDYDPQLPHDQVLLERIAVKYLITVIQEDYFSFKQFIASNSSNSVVLQAYPELGSKLDDDGLLFIDESFKLFDGGIAYKDHILHYHQFLRRGYSSNPNFDFLGRFMRYYMQTVKVNRFRIAIDHHRLMPKEFYRHLFEMDRWFGPQFDKNKLDDPTTVGLTIITRTRPSIFDLTNKLDQTEFYWSYRDGVKSFEIEEVSSEEYTFDSYYLNRYIHSERDTEHKVLRHFDGAVKVYLYDKYRERLATRMPTESKSHKKIKLFRIDGDIDVDTWIDLISHFFKSNEMIIEYFDPSQFEEAFGEKMRRYKQMKQEEKLH